ncbi:hypothetical protein KIN20_028510 [Parelaphostrongylus tenuis]|uniref:PLD phosphodiesterase domain-containing protein n=1 Tax=Parelaphostrongylus tenuis TaxID=148309 RepID=A0AAD5R196_PARTN|nr:hypothetical protein KIN20_028510 [Parelaphostrongylus tenuis]
MKHSLKTAGTSWNSSKNLVPELVSGRMYFSKVDLLPDKFNENAFHLSDILQIIRPQLSIHFNFMIDLEWLIEQYPAPCRDTPMVCVVGEKMGTDRRTLQSEVKASNLKNATILGAALPLPFGTHHTKLSIFDCEDKVHVVVSTANLIEGDWSEKTQCFYYACGSTANTSSSPSESKFAEDLCAYLSEYRLQDVNFWIDRIRSCDFSGVSDRFSVLCAWLPSGQSARQVWSSVVGSTLT